MKNFAAAIVFFSLIVTASAQKPVGLTKNFEYKLKDGHTFVLSSDGKYTYDNQITFARYEDQTMTTENYLPLVAMVKDKKGNTERVYAALEMHEAKTNGKIWFVIYESPLTEMRQSFFKVSDADQARSGNSDKNE